MVIHYAHATPPLLLPLRFVGLTDERVVQLEQTMQLELDKLSCTDKLLLAVASAIVLGSKSCTTCDYIVLSHIFGSHDTLQ
jgi:hypothetical protein